jgi:outer membrane lipoprotein SlyB
MKFLIGFIAGLAVGGFWVSNSTEEQRRRARSAATNAGQRITGSRIGQTIDENASKVASSASDRVVDAVDSTGDALADSISGGDGHGTG